MTAAATAMTIATATTGGNGVSGKPPVSELIAFRTAANTTFGELVMKILVLAVVLTSILALPNVVLAYDDDYSRDQKRWWGGAWNEEY